MIEMGKALGIVSLCVLAFVFLGYLFTGNESNDAADIKQEEKGIVAAEETEETSETEESEAVEEEPEQEYDIVNMDTPININNVLYKVEGYELAKTVAGYTSQSGQYAIVKIKVLNKSNETEDVSNGDFKLVIGNSSYESDATTTAYHDGGFTFEKVNPDMSKVASVVYEVPNNIKDNVSLQVTPNMWKKDETGYIVLK